MLGSGGPLMTVQARSQNLAYCSWFEEDVARHGTYEIASLVRADVQQPLTAPAAISALTAALQKSEEDRAQQVGGIRPDPSSEAGAGS